MHDRVSAAACVLTATLLALPAAAALPGPTGADVAERLLLEAFARNPEALLAEARRIEAVLDKAEGDGIGVLRTDTKDKAVLLVHGRDNYNPSGWGNLRNLYLTTYGFTGGVHRVGYYGGECNVEHRAEHHGSHSVHFGGSGEHSSKLGCNGVSGAQVHDLDTDIRHIAYHVAWMIYDHWTAGGKWVDYVGHSMGGLLVRYAVAKAGTTGFPASLRVEDVTTFGAPHGGLGTSWCKLSPWADVRQMCSDSSLMTWLDANAQNPQGYGGTDWTVMGSDCDGWVAWNLAVDMDVAHKVVAVDPCLGHSDYYADVSTSDNAVMDWMDKPDPNWYRCTACPHSGKWSVYASIYGTW